MTRALAGAELAGRINGVHANAAPQWDDADVWIELDSLREVLRFMKETPDLDFASLISISAVDYIEYFEVVYHLRSMRRNQSAVLKTRCYGRGEPTVPLYGGLVAWRRSSGARDLGPHGYPVRGAPEHEEDSPVGGLSRPPAEEGLPEVAGPAERYDGNPDRACNY